MGLRKDLHPEAVNQCIETLKVALEHILNVRDHTQKDGGTCSTYANIIIDLSTLIRELKCLQ